MKLKKLNRTAKRIARKYDRIEDIILFGSFLKGKDRPRDIDVLLIFKKEVDKKIESEFKSELNDPSMDINSITKKELQGEGFIAKEGIFLEGFSLVTKRKISDLMGFSSLALVRYDLKNIRGSRRVRFYYALQGRDDNKGILAEIKGARFSDNVLICDYDVIDQMRLFLERWDIKFSIIPAMIPKRLRKIILKNK